MRLTINLAVILVVAVVGWMSLGGVAWAEAPLPDAAEVASMTIAEMFDSGGVIMLLLSSLSVLTVALIVQGFLLVRSAQLIPASFVKDATYVLSRRDDSRANDMVASTNHVASKMLAAAVGSLGKTPEKQSQAIESAAIRGLSQVRQRINYLSNIGAIAPMFGLLGTVFGMIKAFNTIAFSSEGAKAVQLAGAISEAMLTTAGGLVVGIPALGFYYFFKGRLSEIVGDVEIAAAAMHDACEVSGTSE